MTFVPTSYTAFIDGLVDAGRWRERGITHWHLLKYEDAIFLPNGKLNERRFRNADILPVVGSCQVVATNPREALTWLAREWTETMANPTQCPEAVRRAAQRGWRTVADWHLQLESSWDTLAGGSLLTPAGGGMEIRQNWSLDLHCYPMTSSRCRRHPSVSNASATARHPGPPANHPALTTSKPHLLPSAPRIAHERMTPMAQDSNPSHEFLDEIGVIAAGARKVTWPAWPDRPVAGTVYITPEPKSDQKCPGCGVWASPYSGSPPHSKNCPYR